jgi:endonuclease III
MTHPIDEIIARLEQLYGTPEWKPRQNPLDELIHCILSQHTSDANSFRAYRLMRERYPTWEAVANAPVEELAATIRSGGLANQKAPRIQAALRAIEAAHGDYSLDWLRDLPTPEARRFLLSLPGIGPKCAAIVLCFALGRPVIPVDTHVFRVSWRLGLIPKSLGECEGARRAGSDDPRAAGVSVPCRADSARARDLQGAEPALQPVPAAGILCVLPPVGGGQGFEIARGGG